MKIQLDNNNYVIAFAIIGDLENSISVNCDDTIFNEYPCNFFKYENNQLILDNDKIYKGSTEDVNKQDFSTVSFAETNTASANLSIYNNLNINNNMPPYQSVNIWERIE